jgi:hypothetical protein
VVSVLATGPKGRGFKHDRGDEFLKQSRAVPLHAMVALGGRGGIAPTNS